MFASSIARRTCLVWLQRVPNEIEGIVAMHAASSSARRSVLPTPGPARR